MLFAVVFVTFPNWKVNGLPLMPHQKRYKEFTLTQARNGATYYVATKCFIIYLHTHTLKHKSICVCVCVHESHYIFLVHGNYFPIKVGLNSLNTYNFGRAILLQSFYK